MFIPNFMHCVHTLTMLTWKDQPFIFGPEQIVAQEDLKQALLDSPVLHPVDYLSPSPVIFTVDTSHIAVGYHLCQWNIDKPKKWYYGWFGSITLNEWEVHILPPKLELYGLFHMLGAMKLYLIGVHNLIVKVDTRYIKEPQPVSQSKYQ